MRGSGALVITAMLDFLTFALCAPYSETTDGTYFDTLLEMVAGDGRAIFRLFQVTHTASHLKYDDKVDAKYIIKIFTVLHD